MTQLRLSFLILIIIIGVFLNIERVDIGSEYDVVNLQSFVYILAFLVVSSTLLLPERFKPTTVYLFLFWGAIYFLAKLVVFDRRPLLGGIYTYLTITELSLLSLLVLSSNRVARVLYDVEDTIANVTLDDVSGRVRHFDRAGEDISKEFARSRRQNVPISVMILKVHLDTAELKAQRTAEEMMQAMLKRYATNKLVRLLDRELRRTDLVLNRPKDDQVVLVLPETANPGTDILAQRIRTIVQEQLGIKISTGYATFPDQALTFDDLLHQAECQTDIVCLEGESKEIDEVTRSVDR